MRIAQIAPPWFPVPPTGYGGTERVVSVLADGLVDRGHEVTLFACPGSVTRAELVTTMDEPPDPAALNNAWDAVYHSYCAYQQAMDPEMGFDVIHDHCLVVGPAMGAMAEHRPPIVHTLHSNWTPESRRHFGMLHEAIELVAISASQRGGNPLLRYAGVVHNGIDVAAFPYCDRKADFLAFLGRASPEKSPVAAIEIAARAGMPLVMMIKANQPEERAYWNEVVEPALAGLESPEMVEVIFNAGHAVKVDRLSRARALLFPIAWEEPFGLAMVEAMACGTPVLATRRGSVPEVIDDGVSGWWLDPDDPVGSALAALERLDVIEPAACRARVETHFAAEVMVDRYERLYRRLAMRPVEGHADTAVDLHELRGVRAGNAER
ncbi:MAG TPA: glycosyltransferase family 4 protein [Microthrixaceae bacterium]|nr:glycosyltransferase family 4 protein [Microthrixaceae bacterium]